MPNSVVKSWSDKYEIPESELEKLWDESYEIASKQYGKPYKKAKADKSKEKNSKIYGTSMKIFKNKVKSKYNIKENLITSFSDFLNESLSQIEIDNIIAKIRDKYSEEEVASMVDELIPEYLDNDWEDDYECEYDAYIEMGRGEAENDVITSIMKNMNLEYDYELYHAIADEYNLKTD